MAEINNKNDLISAGYGGYEGWSDASASEDFRATGGQGKWDPSVASRLGLDLTADASENLVQEIINVINGYEDQLANLGVPALTDTEMDAFLQKAIEQVKPYYEKKRTEIEAGIKEGKVQSAEELLIEMREVRTNIEEQLAKFDLSKAQTEDELANTLAEITAGKEESLEQKTLDWRDRIKVSKEGQVKTGVLTSGIGRKDVAELTERGEIEKANVERAAATREKAVETRAEYSIESIKLAREGAQRERVRRLGTAEEEAATEASALGTLGYDEAGDLPSTAELAQSRAERNISVYKPEALTDLTEEEKRAIESRKLTLQEETLAQKKEKELAQRRKIEASVAKKQRELSLYA